HGHCFAPRARAVQKGRVEHMRHFNKLHAAALAAMLVSGAAAGNPVNAEATFTTSAGKIEITLTNLLSDAGLLSSDQAISDLTFLLSNAPGTLGIQTASGQFGNISSTGVVTYVTSDAQTGFTTPTRWFLGTGAGISGNTITLETIGGTGLGQPSEMIVPFIADGGTYTNADATFSNFNSFVIGPATFTLELSGVTADTTVIAGNFSFGVPSPAPEPASLALIGIAALAAAATRRRCKQLNQSTP